MLLQEENISKQRVNSQETKALLPFIFIIITLSGLIGIVLVGILAGFTKGKVQCCVAALAGLLLFANKSTAYKEFTVANSHQESL